MRPPDGDFSSTYSHTMRRDVVTVPTLRCFCNCSLSCKSIVYIHSTFPYFILDPAEIPIDPQSYKSIDDYLFDVCKEIDNKTLIACSNYKIVPTQIVHEAKLVSAKNVYGYHDEEKPFIHISIYHDRYKSKIHTLCRRGHFFNTQITPYNLHFPHFQQFITDFKVYPLLETLVAKTKSYVRSSVLDRFSYSPFSSTNNALEIDISANDIINRYNFIDRAIPPLEMITSIASQPSSYSERHEPQLLKNAFMNAVTQVSMIEADADKDGSSFFKYYKAPIFESFEPAAQKILTQIQTQNSQNIYKEIALLPFALFNVAFVETLFVNKKLYLISLLLTEFNNGFSEPQKVIFCLLPSPEFSRPIFGARVFYSKNQTDLILKFCKFIEVTDPDFILSFENIRAGISPIINYKKLDTTKLLSRVISTSNDDEIRENDAAYSFAKSPLNGRLLFSTEKIIAKDFPYAYFSPSLLAEKELHFNFPDLDYEYLASPWTEEYSCSFEECVDHFLILNEINMKLLDKIDFFTKTSFFSLIYSTDFISALNRGSQFRVECILQRIGKANGFIFPSPDKQDVADMEPPKFIPLVFEPKAKFYDSPVSVFDFESLYPTVMISFNICFSTCLGPTNDTHKLGCFNYTPPSEITKFYTAPNDTRYVLKMQRLGLIPQMLSEVLQGRRAIKQILKTLEYGTRSYKSLDAAQLALKLVANVTYGYTSATFSGRMPCIDIADSIVSFGRQLMEDVIRAVPNEKVVYGDTDSLFINFPHLNRKQALQRSEDIIQQVNASLPPPIYLKFEKTYLKSFLVTKKRYTGLKVESMLDTPKLEVKGLEAIRRDNCDFVKNTMKDMLLSMFIDTNLTLLKNIYLNAIDQLNNPIYTQFIYSREIRLGSYRHEDRLPPAAAAAQRYFKLVKEHPVLGMRFPFLIQKGDGNVADKACHPLYAHSIDELYYKEQLDRALARIFSLAQIDIMSFSPIFKRLRNYYPQIKYEQIDINVSNKLLLNPPELQVNKIKSYICLYCQVCKVKLRNNTIHTLYCYSCGSSIDQTILIIIYRINYLSKQLFAIKKIYHLYYAPFEHTRSLHNDIFFKKDAIETELKTLFALLNHSTEKLSKLQHFGLDQDIELISD